MDEEVALERASQQIIKLLLREPKFLEEWQKNVEDELERNELMIPGKSETPTSSPATSTLETSVLELASTIEFVISIFECNVDPRDFFFSDTKQSNRNLSLFFETGLKVEMLTNLDMKSTDKEAVAMQISTCCRRVNQELKSLGKRFQSQQSLEISSISKFVHGLCNCFYTISEEILRFSEIFPRKEREGVQSLSRKLHDSSDEFNVKIVEMVEKTSNYLEKEKRRKTAPPPRPRTAPSTSSIRPTSTIKPKLRPLQKPHTRGQIRLVSSIQEAIRLKEKSEKHKESAGFPRKSTHVPGGISTKIVMSNSKPKKLTSSSKAKNQSITPFVDSDRNVLEKEDYDVMKSAIRMTGLVMEDLKQTMRIGNNEHLVLGVGK